MDDFNKIILVCPRAQAEEVVKVFTESVRHPELNAFKTLSDASPRDRVRLDEEETLEQDALQDAKQTVRQRGNLATDEWYILSAEPTSTGDEEADKEADEARLIRACDLLETHFRKGASGFFGTPEAHLASGDLVNKYFYVAPAEGTTLYADEDEDNLDDIDDEADSDAGSDAEVAGDDDGEAAKDA